MLTTTNVANQHFFLWPNRQILGVPKSIQASVTLLENLHIIVEKTPAEDLQAEIFPMLFSSYESTTLQVQVNTRTSLFF